MAGAPLSIVYLVPMVDRVFFLSRFLSRTSGVVRLVVTGRSLAGGVSHAYFYGRRFMVIAASRPLLSRDVHELASMGFIPPYSACASRVELKDLCPEMFEASFVVRQNKSSSYSLHIKIKCFLIV